MTSEAAELADLLEGAPDFIREEIVEILQLLVELDGEGLEVVRALAVQERGQLNADMVRRALKERNTNEHIS